MKSMFVFSRGHWATALAVAGMMFVGTALAGEAISFSGGKAKAEPGQPTPEQKTRVKENERLSAITSRAEPRASGPTVRSTGPVLDAKERRRLEAARDEKRNWMWVEEGELQDKAEKADGIDAWGGDEAFEKKSSGGRDLTFEGLGRARNGASRSGESRDVGRRPGTGPSRNEASDEREPKEDDRSVRESSKASSKQVGRLSGDLGLREFLGSPSDKSAPEGGANENAGVNASLRNILGEGSRDRGGDSLIGRGESRSGLRGSALGGASADEAGAGASRRIWSQRSSASEPSAGGLGALNGGGVSRGLSAPRASEPLASPGRSGLGWDRTPQPAVGSDPFDRGPSTGRPIRR